MSERTSLSDMQPLVCGAFGTVITSGPGADKEGRSSAAELSVVPPAELRFCTTSLPNLG